MILFGYCDEACDVLRAYCRIHSPFELGHLAESEQLDLKLPYELLWAQRPDLRVEDVGWPPFDAKQLDDALLARRRQLCSDQLLQRNYPHLSTPNSPYVWREAPVDVLTASACSRILARPADVDKGAWPTADDTLESYEAMKAAMTVQSDVKTYPFPYELSFDLATRVGELAEAKQQLARFIRGFAHATWSFVQDCLCVPGILAISADLPADAKFVTEEEARSCRDLLVSAVDSRMRDGRQDPLPQVDWPELLQRLAGAAFKLYPLSYKEIGVNAEQDILNPPAAIEQIQAQEAKLKDKVGLFPQDMKDMYLAANGFKGLDDVVAYGGLAPVNECMAGNCFPLLNDLKLYTEERETLPDGRVRVNRNAGGNAAGKRSLWLMQETEHSGASGSVTLVLTPHELWKKYGNADAEEGEYRVIVHEAARDFHEVWASLRHYIGDVVERLEEAVESGYPASEDGDL
ncbi:hypothetical protein B0A50_02770 [Salinomyces thailandicus]|uniref:Knr4/Smi1-like domain-containing protein n=1 Tax=Salinomyces thailandicus TaxID=706561 RepID=A0A4U0U4L4_9PEZI|nr:hypothetical protein B0A50_02770 [Salinomyces thailandica]